MTLEQWAAFRHFREDFRAQCHLWNQEFKVCLAPLQQAAARRDTPEYVVETPVVYNRALEEIQEAAHIKLIIVGDNPGKAEQLRCNRRYLVGQAGKIAEGFFSRSPELGVDFRRDTIILNKTPVHTAKTAHLRHLLREGGGQVQALLRESQEWMARRTAALHQALSSSGCQLWLVGYGELKGRGLFLEYRDCLARSYQTGEPATLHAAWPQVMAFQHFSMNRFTIDLAEATGKGLVDGSLPLQERLALLGCLHRRELFGR